MMFLSMAGCGMRQDSRRLVATNFEVGVSKGVSHQTLNQPPCSRLMILVVERNGTLRERRPSRVASQRRQKVTADAWCGL